MLSDLSLAGKQFTQVYNELEIVALNLNYDMSFCELLTIRLSIKRFPF